MNKASNSSDSKALQDVLKAFSSLFPNNRVLKNTPGLIPELEEVQELSEPLDNFEEIDAKVIDTELGANVSLDLSLNEYSHNYPTELWDYFEGDYHKYVPYMPSRQDREQLLGDERCIQIWDYFFRINLNDIGKPQQVEIARIKAKKRENALSYKMIKAAHKQELEELYHKLQITQVPEEDIEQRIAVIKKEFELLEGEYHTWIIEVDKRIASLQAEIEKLKQQVPQPPSDDVINQWLQKDLERLKRECIRSAGVGTTLAEIAAYDSEGEEVRVDNPIFLISPGELQSPEMIPPAYIPSFDATEKLYRASQPETLAPIRTLAKYVSSNQLILRLLPKPMPDRAKHLLVKQKAITSEGYKIFFGVYYIQMLMISKDMLILYSFFFDFITGKSLADRVIEQYYKDIVAIERSKEHRTIPLSYSDVEKNLDLEYAPSFSLILPGGDRCTITFVNRDYFIGIAKEFEDNKSPLTDESRGYIEKRVNQAKFGADAAINVIRKYLREHKVSMQ